MLEEDGTEVDEDYLPFVQANTVLMLLSTDDQWSGREGAEYRLYILDIQTRRFMLINYHVYLFCLITH